MCFDVQLYGTVDCHWPLWIVTNVNAVNAWLIVSFSFSFLFLFFFTSSVGATLKGEPIRLFFVVFFCCWRLKRRAAASTDRHHHVNASQSESSHAILIAPTTTTTTSTTTTTTTARNRERPQQQQQQPPPPPLQSETKKDPIYRIVSLLSICREQKETKWGIFDSASCCCCCCCCCWRPSVLRPPRHPSWALGCKYNLILPTSSTTNKKTQ